jgi:predicted nucleic acid-binding protein
MSDTQHPPKAILDTSVLLTLYYLGHIESLQLLFSEVRIPREVEAEFLQSRAIDTDSNDRFKFLTETYDNHKTWFKACNEYGSDLVKIYLSEPGIDKGEAEAFAQHQALGGIHTVLIDEKRGRNVARNWTIAHHGVLSVIARFDLQLKLCDYKNTIAFLEASKIGRFSPNIIEKVYNEIKTELGLI